MRKSPRCSKRQMHRSVASNEFIALGRTNRSQLSSGNTLSGMHHPSSATPSKSSTACPLPRHYQAEESNPFTDIVSRINRSSVRRELSAIALLSAVSQNELERTINKYICYVLNNNDDDDDDDADTMLHADKTYIMLELCLLVKQSNNPEMAITMVKMFCKLLSHVGMGVLGKATLTAILAVLDSSIRVCGIERDNIVQECIAKAFVSSQLALKRCWWGEIAHASRLFNYVSVRILSGRRFQLIGGEYQYDLNLDESDSKFTRMGIGKDLCRWIYRCLFSFENENDVSTFRLNHNVSPEVIKLLIYCCAVIQVRAFCVKKVESWIQQPRISAVALELLVAVVLNGRKGQDDKMTVADTCVVMELMKLKLKSPSTNTVLTSSINQRLFETDKCIDMYMQGAVSLWVQGWQQAEKQQTGSGGFRAHPVPRATPGFIAPCVATISLLFKQNQRVATATLADSIVNVLLMNMSETLERNRARVCACRALLRELMPTNSKSPPIELSFRALFRRLLISSESGSWQRASMDNDGFLDPGKCDLLMFALVDIVVMCLFMALSKLGTCTDEKMEKFRKLVQFAESAMIQMLVYELPERILKMPSWGESYLVNNKEYVRCLYKSIFMDHADQYTLLDDYPVASDRNGLFKVLTDVTPTEELLLGVVDAGIHKFLPLSQASAVELVEQLMRRVAGAKDEERRVLKMKRCRELIGNLQRLALFQRPNGPGTCEGDKVLVAATFWRLSFVFIMLLCYGHDEKSVLKKVWNELPTVKMMIEMLLTNQFTSPPATTVIRLMDGNVRRYKNELAQVEADEEAMLKRCFNDDVPADELTHFYSQAACQKWPRQISQQCLDKLKALNNLLKLAKHFSKNQNLNFLVELVSELITAKRDLLFSNHAGADQCLTPRETFLQLIGEWLPHLSESRSIGNIPLMYLCEYIFDVDPVQIQSSTRTITASFARPENIKILANYIGEANERQQSLSPLLICFCEKLSSATANLSPIKRQLLWDRFNLVTAGKCGPSFWTRQRSRTTPDDPAESDSLNIFNILDRATADEREKIVACFSNAVQKECDVLKAQCILSVLGNCELLSADTCFLETLYLLNTKRHHFTVAILSDSSELGKLLIGTLRDRLAVLNTPGKSTRKSHWQSLQQLIDNNRLADNGLLKPRPDIHPALASLLCKVAERAATSHSDHLLTPLSPDYDNDNDNDMGMEDDKEHHYTVPSPDQYTDVDYRRPEHEDVVLTLNQIHERLADPSFWSVACDSQHPGGMKSLFNHNQICFSVKQAVDPKISKEELIAAIELCTACSPDLLCVVFFDLVFTQHQSLDVGLSFLESLDKVEPLASLFRHRLMPSMGNISYLPDTILSIFEKFQITHSVSLLGECLLKLCPSIHNRSFLVDIEPATIQTKGSEKSLADTVGDDHEMMSQFIEEAEYQATIASEPKQPSADGHHVRVLSKSIRLFSKFTTEIFKKMTKEQEREIEANLSAHSFILNAYAAARPMLFRPIHFDQLTAISRDEFSNHHSVRAKLIELTDILLSHTWQASDAGAVDSLSRIIQALTPPNHANHILTNLEMKLKRVLLKIRGTSGGYESCSALNDMINSSSMSAYRVPTQYDLQNVGSTLQRCLLEDSSSGVVMTLLRRMYSDSLATGLIDGVIDHLLPLLTIARASYSKVSQDIRRQALMVVIKRLITVCSNSTLTTYELRRMTFDTCMDCLRPSKSTCVVHSILEQFHQFLLALDVQTSVDDGSTVDRISMHQCLDAMFRAGLHHRIPIGQHISNALCYRLGIVNDVVRLIKQQHQNQNNKRPSRHHRNNQQQQQQQQQQP